MTNSTHPYTPLYRVHLLYTGGKLQGGPVGSTAPLSLEGRFGDAVAKDWVVVLLLGG